MHYSFGLEDRGWECGFGHDLVYREPVGASLAESKTGE